MENLDIRTGYIPGAIGRVVELHGETASELTLRREIGPSDSAARKRLA